MVSITSSNGELVSLRPASAKKFRGARLPGADLFEARLKSGSLWLHEYHNRLFSFSLRTFDSANSAFGFSESTRTIRIEAVLQGRLTFINQHKEEIIVDAGQYRVTQQNPARVTCIPAKGSMYLIVFIQPTLLDQTPLADLIYPGSPRFMVKPVRDIILRILDNPYEERFRDALYDYCVRELLFYLGSMPYYAAPGELSDKELSIIYEADHIIAADLTMHHTLHDLARMTRSNVSTIKHGFAKVFGMGPFERLIQRKMDKAVLLLETTNKQIQEIADLSGYETVTGFINAFRHRFKQSPLQWRTSRKP